MGYLSQQSMKDQQLDKFMTLIIMNEIAMERNAEWSIEIVNEFPQIREIKSPVMLGSFAWSSLVLRRKWMQEKQTTDLGGGHVTPADIARDYLTSRGHKTSRRRMTTNQYQKLVVHRKSAPLYAEPCEIENAVYVDLTSAYWSILRVVGWDLEYNPNRYLAVGQSVDDFPVPENKLARNCLVTVGVNGSMNMWTGEVFKSIKKPNPFSNMMLYGLVMDVLNGIAYDMVHYAGAKYVHTDGYILPERNIDLAFEVAARWGLQCGTKLSGGGTIRGVSDYDIGTRKSGLRRTTLQRQHSNLQTIENGWLRSAFGRWSLLS